MEEKREFKGLNFILFFILSYSSIYQVPRIYKYYLFTANYGKERYFPFKYDPSLTSIIEEPYYWSGIALVVLSLLAYLMAELFYPTKYYLKKVSVFLVILLTVIFPTIMNIWVRALVSPAVFAHDGGVIQTEIAMKLILEGKNPYGFDYSNTEMSQAMDSNPQYWQSLGYSQNPALKHYPYLPLAFLSGIPFHLFSNFLFGWYDQRFLYLIFYFLVLILATKFAEDKERKLSLYMLIGLNPLMTRFIAEGRNDILILGFTMAGLYFLCQKRYFASSVMFGLGMSCKQYLFLLWMVYLLYLGIQKKYSEKGFLENLASRWREILPSIITPVIFTIPFLISDPVAFINDVYAFNAGTIADSYPIKGVRGYGFANFVLAMKWVSSPRDYFPFIFFQAIFTLPIFVLALIRLSKRPLVSEIALMSALILFIFSFFSRFLADNYLGFIFSILVIGFFCEK